MHLDPFWFPAWILRAGKQNFKKKKEAKIDILSIKKTHTFPLLTSTSEQSIFHYD